MLQLPEWGGGSSPVKTVPPQIVLLLLLDGLTLAFFFRSFSSVKCVFLFHVQRKLSLFFGKRLTPPKRVVHFPRERDAFRNKIMEIVEDFDEKNTTAMVNHGNRQGF